MSKSTTADEVTTSRQEYEARVQKLVEALRSGEFKQGVFCLRSEDDAYCCLGVACEVYRRETELGEWQRDDECSSQTFIDADSWHAETSLPDCVQEWYGFHTTIGTFVSEAEIGVQGNDGQYTCTLIALNDRLGYDFSRIADVIDQRPSQMFDWA